MHILRRIPLWTAIVLLVYMPFHIFLAQSVSLLTGGLDAWKIGKDALLAVVVMFTICLVWQQRVGTKVYKLLVCLTGAYLGLHILLWACNPGLYQVSAGLGTIYNVRLLAFLLLGYGAVLLYPAKFVFSSVMKLALTVGMIVAALGILQFLLPKDILTHVGYSLERGVRPAFFIDNNQAFPRIMSTLREPNALGAYLLVPLALATIWMFKVRQRWLLVVGWLSIAAAIVLTFSRSAWLAAALVVAVLIWRQFSTQFVRLTKGWWPFVMVAVSLLILVGLAQQNNAFIRSYITHSTPEVVEDLDSNDYHWLLTRQGIEGVLGKPQGHGPGTAGIVSIQNPKGAFLTENYYVQIAYEVGIIGLLLFIAVSIFVYIRLHRRHDDIGAVLLVTFWAYVLTNMLLHTWSNEAVAAQWWLLAGMAMFSGRTQALK